MCPGLRLRRWCSSRYLRISPLHREFRDPLHYSSSAVSDALPRLSRGLSHPTCRTAYVRFTPNDSEQRLHPPYYRGCWHGVSRCLLRRYRQGPALFTPGWFVPPHRALRPEGLHHSRGMAGSGLRPLPNIPHCCLPQESGPCLSSSVADHPLRPATRLRLGGPLPRQLADGPRAAPSVVAFVKRPPFPTSAEALADVCGISNPFGLLSPAEGHITHVLRTRPPLY